MTNHILSVYSPLPIQFDHGDGVWLYDTNGNKYLDAYCGIAVTGLGHNNPAVTATIQKQAAKILHVSNFVEIPQQMKLADLLVDLVGVDGKAFFNNSGAEAVETMIKLARLYGHSKNIETPKIIVFEGAFHGRTMATISVGASAKAQAGFGPLLQGLVRVKYNDPVAIETALKLDKDIVAVLIEPIQGESGVQVPSSDYLNKVRALCDKYHALMLIDEVQTGMGRTGHFFCFEHNKIKPDATALAKGLANGVPIGACVIRAPYCDLFKPGSHGATFGGNPLSCATAITTINEIINHKWYDNAAKQGKKILASLKKSLADNKHVIEVRGKGLMIGIQLDKECRDIAPIALRHGIIFNIANLNTIRLLPPLIIDDTQTQFICDTIPLLIQELYAAAESSQ
jgi:acetylornithine aminotransferase